MMAEWLDFRNLDLPQRWRGQCQLSQGEAPWWALASVRGQSMDLVPHPQCWGSVPLIFPVDGAEYLPRRALGCPALSPGPAGSPVCLRGVPGHVGSMS